MEQPSNCVKTLDLLPWLAGLAARALYFGCNGYASRRATPQRVGIAALTSHQLMR